MILWRISRHHDLKGIGGQRVAGRWHHAGQPVVYLAESPAGALLEVCVHTSANDVPPDFTLLKVEYQKVRSSTVRKNALPANWESNIKATRDLGTIWLSQGKTALLKVPSAIVPQTFNFVLNPLHPDAAKFRVVSARTLPFDHRLKI